MKRPQKLAVMLVPTPPYEICGLGGAIPETLVEIGKRFNVSRERIRQIEDVALTKLRSEFMKLDTPAVLPSDVNMLRPNFSSVAISA